MYYKKGRVQMTAKKKSAHELMPNIKIIGVVGAGQMGKGIAQIAAQSGFEVVVVTSSNEEMMQKARAEINASLHRAVEIGKIIKKQKDKIISRLIFSMELNSLEKSDIVIDAVV